MRTEISGTESSIDADTLCGDRVRDVVAERAREQNMTFALAGSGLVVVSNESHERPGDHTYVVIVEDGAVVECSCPYAQSGGRGGDACKHRVAVAMRPAVMAAAEADADDHANADYEPVIRADGGEVERHADGCDERGGRCEGLDAPGRPELSFDCYEVWAAESHDWSEESTAEEEDMTLTEDDMVDLSVEQIVATFEARGRL